jgi:hypothetical protein
VRPLHLSRPGLTGPALVVGLSGVLALSACGSSDDDAAAPSTTTPAVTTTTAAPAPTTAAPTTPAPTTPAGPVITVSYAGGKVSGDTGRTKVKVGETVTIRVTSDSAQEVHIHGADVLFEVPAGQTIEKTFSEKAPGVYEIELHPSDFVLARVEAS